MMENEDETLTTRKKKEIITDWKSRNFAKTETTSVDKIYTISQMLLLQLPKTKKKLLQTILCVQTWWNLIFSLSIRIAFFFWSHFQKNMDRTYFWFEMKSHLHYILPCTLYIIRIELTQIKYSIRNHLVDSIVKH